MSFSYDENVLDDNLNYVRLKLGDTVKGEGPRPQHTQRNFSNNEINQFIADEDTLNGAIAAGLEQLAREWRAWAFSRSDGESSRDYKQIADGYAKEADRMRQKPDATEGGVNAPLFEVY